MIRRVQCARITISSEWTAWSIEPQLITKERFIPTMIRIIIKGASIDYSSKSCSCWKPEFATKIYFGGDKGTLLGTIFCKIDLIKRYSELARPDRIA